MQEYVSHLSLHPGRFVRCFLFAVVKNVFNSCERERTQFDVFFLATFFRKIVAPPRYPILHFDFLIGNV